MKQKIWSALILCAALSACSPPRWAASDSIILDDVSPIGMVMIDDHIVVADGDNNRIVTANADGQLDPELQWDEMERPMHIDMDGEILYVPSYGADAILMLHDGRIDTLDVPYEMDAPAAVSVEGEDIAIADFYNGRVLLRHGSEWMVIGSKGKNDGEFSYPTDVQIHDQQLYVADAYNHRVQVFDLSGKHLLTFGKEEKMNAATGILVDDQEVWATDFENDRILSYDKEGKVQQIIDTGLNKPTDLYKQGDKLYVTNYKGQYISIFEK